MPGAQEMPLAEVLQALGRTPTNQPQMRAVLSTTCARWHLERGQIDDAVRHLSHAVQMVPDLRPAMRLLYRICGERGDVRTAVNYLDQEIRATRHPREAAALYRERGQLVEAHFRDLGAAQQCYEAALKATPHDLAVLRAVERVCLARGDIFGLMDILEAQLESLKDPEAIASVLRDLALLEARRGGDLTLASNLLIAALRYAPKHPGLISDLFRMAECSGDPDLLLRALELEADARRPEGRGMPLARASVIFREHRERAAAIALLEAAASAQPHNFSLWRNLEDLSMSSSRYDMAMRACLGQLKAIGDDEDPAARAELLHRVGKLALFRLDRVPEGLSAMRKALRLCPGHATALEDAGRYLAANEMWAQLLELAKLEISTATKASLTAEELANVHLRAGQLMEERLREPEGARQFYRDALTVHPTFRPAQDRLERILHQLGHVEELREYYKNELDSVTEKTRRIFLLSVLGQLYARQHDPGDAIKYLVALLKELPDHLPSLQLLARLLSRAKRPKDLLRVTEQEVKLTSSPVRRAKLLHRAGELAIELDERERAKEFFTRALDAIDDHPPSIESLDRLLREDGDDEALMELLRKKLLYANDRARQLGLRLEIANLLATKLDRKEHALAELEQLLQRWPRHLPAQHMAEGLAASLGREDTLLKLLEQHIAAASGPRTRALLLHRAAIIRSRRGDAQAAVRDLVRALELWPQLGVARALLLRLYEQLGRDRELQAFAESGLTSERGADDRRAMALQLAELTPRAIVAIQYLGAVAEARPEDFITQIRLARASRRARRPSREAGALAAAADRFAEELAADDPHLLAFRYRAARAQESAGNLDVADQGYAQVLDRDPGHQLARNGRLRVKDRQRAGVLAKRAGDLQKAAQEAETPAQKAACLTIAAELQERRRDLLGALELVNTALQHCPEYLPALHGRARLLERFGEAANLAGAVETLQEIAGRLRSPTHRARVLCRAGTIALQTIQPPAPNPKAWGLFRDALAADPDCDPAFRGLQRVHALHGTEGAPKLAEILGKRLDVLRSSDRLGIDSLREISRIGGDTDGPQCAVDLIERGKDSAAEDPGLHADLAQAYARLGRWPDVVRELETALDHEVSPERAAIIHFFAADALEHAQDLPRAIDHYIAAGHGGFHPRRALLAADRIAERIGAVERRAEALQALVDVEVGPERARSLRALAELYRGPLGEPDTAVEIMRQLLLLRPTDIDVLSELQRLLVDLDRPDEAAATALAGVAHQRAWLRQRGVRDDSGEGIDVEPLVGLCVLFDALSEIDGVYMSAGILEVIAPDQVPEGRECDSLVSEPWPLPSPQEGRPFDVLIGDLPCTFAVDLLREGVFYLSEIPGVLPPPVDLSPSRSLPPSSAAVIVTRALSDAMGVRQPLVFLDPSDDGNVVAHVGAMPCLIVGKRINASPFAPLSRDLIGRALLRLTTGGDFIHREATPAQIAGLVAGLARGAGVETGPLAPCDQEFAAAVASSLPGPEALGELAEVARAFAEHAAEFDASALRAALQMAEDRAGTVCAADPRPTVRLLAQAGDLATQRATTLFGYLVSDDHLGLRRTIGYGAAIELDAADIEEVPP